MVCTILYFYLDVIHGTASLRRVYVDSIHFPYLVVHVVSLVYFT